MSRSGPLFWPLLSEDNSVARTNLPVTALPGHTAVAVSTTAVDQTNGMNCALASTAIPSASNSERLVLVVANTDTLTHNVILRAGASNPPAFRKDIGDLTLAVANATTRYIGPFEWARFCQADGSLNIDFSSGFAGTIQALLLAREF